MLVFLKFSTTEQFEWLFDVINNLINNLYFGFYTEPRELRTWMDVCLHYKTNQDESSDLLLITERALQHFPGRVLPVFTPWFPSNAAQRLPIKPKKSPPAVTWNHVVQNSERISERSESPCQKSADLSKRKGTSGSDPADDDRPVRTAPVAKKPKRCWSVIPQKTRLPDLTNIISRHFHKIIHKYGLDLHQRAKLVICELNCAPLSIDEVWSRISQAIKHATLPTCNANYQRDASQIWLYCDLGYCEYTGNVLRETFQLTGNITLAVHKLGDVFSLWHHKFYPEMFRNRSQTSTEIWCFF